MELQGTQNTITMMKKKKVRELILPDLKTYQWRKNSFFNKWFYNNYIQMQKNEGRLLPNTMYKNQLKVDQRLHYKMFRRK